MISYRSQNKTSEGSRPCSCLCQKRPQIRIMRGQEKYSLINPGRMWSSMFGEIKLKKTMPITRYAERVVSGDGHSLFHKVKKCGNKNVSNISQSWKNTTFVEQYVKPYIFTKFDRLNESRKAKNNRHSKYCILKIFNEAERPYSNSCVRSWDNKYPYHKTNYGRDSVNGDFPCAEWENATKIHGN